MGEFGRQAGQWISDNKNWLVPLAAGGGAALSTPSAGGAGPIMGSALSTGTGTALAMQQAEATRAAAAAKQAALEEYRRGQLAVREGANVLKGKALETPRPLTQEEKDLKVAQTKKANQPPPVKVDPIERDLDRRISEAQREIQSARSSYLRTHPWENDMPPELLGPVVTAAAGRHKLNPEQLGQPDTAGKVVEQPTQPPPVGAVMEGYRYNGGDPRDPKNWQLAQ